MDRTFPWASGRLAEIIRIKMFFFLKYVTRDWADFVVITRVPLRVAVSIRGYVTGEIREKQTKKKTNNYYFPDLPSARIRT